MDLKELDRLEDGAEVYKLIGPVLVRQELTEAKQNVQKRIDYIRKEMSGNFILNDFISIFSDRVESLLTDSAQNIESQREKIERTRNKLRQAVQQHAGGPVPATP